ncbi:MULTISPECIES: dihydrolipoyllysine-residue acetyltransferase [Hydrocarboniphaga]|jgi:pyruvate dehydrogenase E2 component (dihydrolipoamide acetyltransferase)|uniref:Acetyltransferase component of pyruvate dehydrogenase complex n=2 Tax=Hydrocarboniphaga effusa TaxID=243629 RepID=I7ZJK7_9GAMM|nr:MULTISPECIES: dihydrolipoyllysine-residue acetyltransferase [Hydrocarboniphaga]EIT72109.1 dihydrolipoamide acetyltransferase [Hydrocarboniphaga effusa AP103]MDZ4078988.1 dihydrolipoyllysine-residue acetyltransferase [Hydrocarboniphaga sp.]
MAKTIEIKVPDIGDSHDVPVIELLVAVGDTLAKEQALLVLESDKATMEVPSPEAGVLKSLAVKVGDKLSTGSVIGVLEVGGAAEEAPAKSEAKPAAKEEAQAAPATKPEPEKAKAPAAEKQAAAPAAKKPAKSGGSTTTNVTIPDIGDFAGVPVIEVLVKDGDTVTAEQAIIVLETDKATMEIPSPAAGVVSGFKLKVGDKVSKGDAICTLQGEGGGEASADEAEAEPEAPQPAPEAKAEKSEKPEAAAPAKSTEHKPAAPAAETPQAASGKPGEMPYAGPGTRKFARELGVDLGKVKGSGKGGRIVIEDVQGFVKQTLAQPPAAAAPAGGGIPPIPAQDFSLYGEIETVALARIRKISAQHLHRAWVNIPHVTQTDEADITDLEAFRKSASDDAGVKLTLLPFVMKAVEKVLVAYPDFCSSLSPDGASLIRKKYVHIGFAADTPNGLVVPVVRDVDKKGIVELAKECGELAKKARDGKLKPDDMKGGCFSISSLGGIGGGYFTPIVNAPEVGILGVSKGVMKPVWDGKAFQPRLMLPLSLSYDHRVIDGAYAARAIVLLGKLLGDLRRLAL